VSGILVGASLNLVPFGYTNTVANWEAAYTQWNAATGTTNMVSKYYTSTLPTTLDDELTAMNAMGIAAIMCYDGIATSYSSSVATQLQNSLTALTGLGVSIAGVVFHQEPQDASTGITAAECLSCYQAWYPVVKAVYPSMPVWYCPNQNSAGWLSYFPGPPNLAACYCDGVTGDYYASAGHWEDMTDPSIPGTVILADDNGLSHGWLEMGRAASGAPVTPADMAEMIGFATDLYLGREAASLPIAAVCWWQGPSTPTSPGYNVLTPVNFSAASEENNDALTYNLGGSRGLYAQMFATLTGAGPLPPAPSSGPPPTAVPVFVAGYEPVPSDFDGWVQTPFTFLTAGTVYRGVQEVPGGQALAAGSNVLSYDTVPEDPYGGWSAVATSSQPANSWLVPYTGTYEITVTASSSSAGWIGAGVQVSGGTAETGQNVPTPSGSPSGVSSATVTVQLTGGVDYIQGVLNCSASGSTDTATAGLQPSMEITYVSS